jgi:DDE superfamily endonuclease
LLVLAHPRKGETFAELAAGLGIRTTIAWRYVTETVALLVARATKLRAAIRDAKKAGYAYVVIDGTLIAIDQVAAERAFYSGKHKKHGMNLQVIASPDGDIVWVSGALPGTVHDKKAEWIWGVLAELQAADLVTLAIRATRETRTRRSSTAGRTNPSPRSKPIRRTHNSAHPAKRANAQLKTWRILRKLRCGPWRAGQSAKAIHVLQLREAYPDGKGSMSIPARRSSRLQGRSSQSDHLVSQCGRCWTA